MRNRDKRQEIRDKRYAIGLIVFAVFLSLITYLLSPITISAQESTPSSTLMNKLNELKSEIASKAAQIKSEINKKVQDKAVMGQILSVSTSEIILQTIGSTRTVKVDEFTEVIGSKNKKIKIETLEDSDSIAALGDMDDKNNLVARRIVFLDNAATVSANLVWGQIQKTTGLNITVKDKDGESKNILTNAQTSFFLSNNEASIADAKVEKFMVARGTRLNDGSIRARFIYFIPSVGFVKPNEQKPNIITKSASPSASKKP